MFRVLKALRVEKGLLGPSLPSQVWLCKILGGFMGNYKWGYKWGNYNYNPYSGTYNPPMNLQVQLSSSALQKPCASFAKGVGVLFSGSR